MGLREDGRQTLRKFSRAITMKTAVENIKRCNTAADSENLKTIKEKELMQQIAFDSTLFRSVV